MSTKHRFSFYSEVNALRKKLKKPAESSKLPEISKRIAYISLKLDFDFKIRFQLMKTWFKILARAKMFLYEAEYETDELDYINSLTCSIEAISADDLKVKEHIEILLNYTLPEIIQEHVKYNLHIESKTIEVLQFPVPFHKQRIVHELLDITCYMYEYGSYKNHYLIGISLTKQVNHHCGINGVYLACDDMDIFNHKKHSIYSLPDNIRLYYTDRNAVSFRFSEDNYIVNTDNMSFLKRMPESGWFIKRNHRHRGRPTILLLKASWELSSKERDFIKSQHLPEE